MGLLTLMLMPTAAVVSVLLSMVHLQMLLVVARVRVVMSMMMMKCWMQAV